MSRLVTASQVHGVRTMLATKQAYRCPICKNTLAGKVPALDHCHITGNIRAALCGTCNTSEGKVRYGARYRAPRDHLIWHDDIQWLRNLADYLEYHKNNPSGLIHPTFDINTGKQKPVKRKPKKKV